MVSFHHLLVMAGLMSTLLPGLWGQDSLVIVSPHWEGVKEEFTQGFQHYYTDKYHRTIQLHWKDLGATSQIEKAVDALYRSNEASCDIDLFFGGGMDPYENQKQKGHLFPYKISQQLLDQIPKQVQGVNLIDPDYTYYGAALSSFGILQNIPVSQSLGLPHVENWEDLTQPSLMSWISAADPRKSGSVHMIYEIILQAYGWEKGWSILYRMGGNIRSFVPGPMTSKEVSSGETAYGVTIDINGLSQQAYLGKDRVRFFIPAQFSIINPDGIAIFKGAPHLQAAEEFLTFVLSPIGQALWMHPLGSPGGAKKYGITRMGIIPGMYSNDPSKLLVPVNPFTQQIGFRYDNALGSVRWQLVNELIGQTIIDVHPQLQAAWQAINRHPAGESNGWMKEFSQPFLNEREAEKLFKIWRTDPLAAARLSNEWMQEAVRRYDRVRREAEGKG